MKRRLCAGLMAMEMLFALTACKDNSDHAGDNAIPTATHNDRAAGRRGNGQSNAAGHLASAGHSAGSNAYTNPIKGALRLFLFRNV